MWCLKHHQYECLRFRLRTNNNHEIRCCCCWRKKSRWLVVFCHVFGSPFSAAAAVDALLRIELSRKYTAPSATNLVSLVRYSSRVLQQYRASARTQRTLRSLWASEVWRVSATCCAVGRSKINFSSVVPCTPPPLHTSTYTACQLLLCRIYIRTQLSRSYLASRSTSSIYILRILLYMIQHIPYKICMYST